MRMIEDLTKNFSFIRGGGLISPSFRNGERNGKRECNRQPKQSPDPPRIPLCTHTRPDTIHRHRRNDDPVPQGGVSSRDLSPGRASMKEHTRPFMHVVHTPCTVVFALVSVLADVVNGSCCCPRGVADTPQLHILKYEEQNAWGEAVDWGEGIPFAEEVGQFTFDDFDPGIDDCSFQVG